MDGCEHRLAAGPREASCLLNGGYHARIAPAQTPAGRQVDAPAVFATSWCMAFFAGRGHAASTAPAPSYEPHTLRMHGRGLVFFCKDAPVDLGPLGS